MTLIECFTESHIDNLAACLLLRPETMIIVGSEEEMPEYVSRYQKVLKNRGYPTQIRMYDVQGKDFGDICAVFKRLVCQESECVIDLTGGEEPVIMAVGAVLAGLDEARRARIHVQRFDFDRDAALDCVHGNCAITGKPITLSVEELVTIHGGSLHPQAYQLPADCSRKDLEPLWRIVAENPKHWNYAVMLLKEFESRSASKTEIRLSLEQLQRSIHNYSEKAPVVLELLEKLEKRGIIENTSYNETLQYTYRNAMFRYCLQKAGNVLEIKTLLEGRALRDNGAPYFRDCRTSVTIDWDGVLHAPAEHVSDTRNEVDVVLMHGTTPLFISCKNGNIEEEELYKLYTVAHRFGGPYAKKMLIATEMDPKKPTANRSFMQRAWDMDIFLVSDAADLSKEEWREAFRNAML